MPRKRKNVVSADLFACTSESDSIPCGQSKFRCISSDSDSSDSDSLFSLNANLDVETVPERPQEPSTSSSSDCGPFGENFYSICQKLSSEEKAIKYCQSVGLLAKKSWCPNCKCVVSKLQQIKARTQSYTQYRFQCNKNKCKKSGRNTVPLRKGSWFSGTNLSVRKSILLLYCFSKKFPYKLAAEETRLSYDKGTSTETISDHYNYCRELCMNVVEKSGVNQIGGPGETVEIDEAKFGKRKYNRGRLVDGTWVFGGICRESRKFFLVPVEKRDAATLLPIIQAHIKEGSTIISDEWAAYRGISELGYAHQTVNHSKNFVGGIENVALNKPASMSSCSPLTYVQAGAAVDGDTSANWPNVINTAEKRTFAWWKVDLLTAVQDAIVKIYFRTDYIVRRRGVRIYTSTSPLSGQGSNDQLCHTVTGSACGYNINYIYSVTCPGRWRYLLLFTNTDNDEDGPVLDFGEVEVLVNTCDTGYYGEDCDKHCSDRKCNNASYSACVTGRCTHGCDPGWWQEDCTQECETGFYGPECNLSCNDRKCNVPLSQCDPRTGQCAGGCQAGYQGADCSQQCSTGVTYGVNCDRNCSSRHCVTSPHECDTQTGQCPDGCEPGWTELDCTSPTNNKNTVTSTPDNVSSLVTAMVGSVFVTLLIDVLLVVGLYIFLIKRGRLLWVNTPEERKPIQAPADNAAISFISTQPVEDSEDEQSNRHVYNNDYEL